MTAQLVLPVDLPNEQPRPCLQGRFSCHMLLRAVLLRVTHERVSNVVSGIGYAREQ
jgi:hypothetical protein